MRPPQEKATKLRNSYPAHHPVYKDDGGGDIPVPVPVAMGGTGATSSASARQNLGLGSIATRDAGTGASDFRDNAENDARFMQPGAFGLGAAGDGPLLADFFDYTIPNGFYRWDANTANRPDSIGGGGAIKFERGVNRMGWIAMRSAGGLEPQIYTVSTDGSFPGNWGPWREIWHAGNLRSNAENDAAFVALTGDQDIDGVKTFLAGLSIAMAEPQWAMTDTSDGNKAVAIALLGNQFLIAADRNGDGTVEGPIALLLNSDNNTAQLYGSLAYTRANILGTVGQSGGVPTGSIMERGANANGEFVRYADGRLECRRSATVNLTTTGAQVFALPASFSDFPAMSWSGGPGTISSGDLPALASAWVYETSTSASRWIFRTNVAGSTTAYTVQLLAIGRWN